MNLGLNKYVFLSVLFFAGKAGAVTPPVAVRDLAGLVRNPDGRIEFFSTRSDVRAPLGSLYKLFVYAYLSESAQAESRYTCRGHNPEEVFCCVPGESIDRNRALGKSCSPYFSFERLGVKETDWSLFWKDKLASTPEWLTKTSRLRPETVVPVIEILDTLAAIRARFSTFREIQTAAFGSVLFGTAANALKDWGSTLRVKTYTWRSADTQDRTDELGFTGGFAGWLPDGSAIWVSRAGHGKDAFQKELRSLVLSHIRNQDPECVRVKFFDRYPILQVSTRDEWPRGPVVVQFKNGNSLRFVADGHLKIRRAADGITFSAEMDIDQYVARVLDREASSVPLEAARALAVAIRTFLYQNSRQIESCRVIGDSSHFQRVSPASPSPASLEIARWTEGLLLEGVKNLRYHSSKASPDRMSWVQARDLAQDGDSMMGILKFAYPEAKLAFGTQRRLGCDPNPSAAQWIAEQSKRWRGRLVSEIGFENPSALKVCLSESKGRAGEVHADLISQEIFVPRLITSEDELSVLHEYLHLGFRSHPKGTNEVFVENLARKLQEVR